jgi:probable rRNA maturation factor
LNIEIYCDIQEAIAHTHPISGDQWQEWFAKWASYLQAEDEITDGEYELSLTITDDATIQALNQQYRQIDRPTDVLSFAALEAEIPDLPQGMLNYAEPICLGDIIISQTTAIRQAQERQHSLTYELGWLAAHGLLHLIGWDHPDDQSLEAMLAQQEHLLKLIDVSL